MGFFSKIFGKAVTVSAEFQVQSLAEIVARDIETTKGELEDAQTKLAAAMDPEIKASLELLVERKKQAIIDLQEKLSNL